MSVSAPDQISKLEITEALDADVDAEGGMERWGPESALPDGCSPVMLDNHEHRLDNLNE
jgi:hypothetical protein